jgi:hypothetical protein
MSDISPAAAVYRNDIAAVREYVRDHRVPAELHHGPVVNRRHEEMARLMAMGYSRKQIAEIMGCSYQHVCIVARSPMFRNKVEELGVKRDTYAAKLRARLDVLADDALDEFEHALTSTDEEMRFKAASKIVDKVFDGQKRDAPVDVNVQINNMAGEFESVNDAAKRMESIIAAERKVTK